MEQCSAEVGHRPYFGVLPGQYRFALPRLLDELPGNSELANSDRQMLEAQESAGDGWHGRGLTSHGQGYCYVLSMEHPMGALTAVSIQLTLVNPTRVKMMDVVTGGSTLISGTELSDESGLR